MRDSRLVPYQLRLKARSRRLRLARDAHRTAALAVLNLRVMRFTNAEVMEQFEAVCAHIEAALKT
jgi:very-short-patch-repair endonuclease